MSGGGLFGGIATGMAAGDKSRIDEMEAQQKLAAFKQAQQDKLLTRMKAIEDGLTDAFLEPDPHLRNTSVDALIGEYEQISGKPAPKNFVSWAKKSPEDAATVLSEASARGLPPGQFLQMVGDPILLAHGLKALGRSKREKEARLQRGDGGGSPVTAPSPAPTPEAPQVGGGGRGISFGGVAESGGNDVMARPVASVMSPAAETPASTVPSTPKNSAIEVEKANVLARTQALGRRIDALAGMGRDEKEITPLRTEKATLEAELRKLNVEAPQAAAVADATEAVKPVPVADIAVGVDAAKRAGRADLAARFVPGMRRGAYDALLSQLGTTQSSATAPAPSAASASPDLATLKPAAAPAVSAPAASQSDVRKAEPTNLVQTPAESETEKASIQRREQKLPEDIMRDPAVIKAGVKTQGELEDAIKSGSVKLQDLSQKARSLTLATSTASSIVKDFEAIKTEGMHARTIARYYDVLGAAAEKAGPRGPWLTPVRDVVNNLANVLAIPNPSGQSNLQLMESVSNKLIPELTMKFKGSQSDREFLAGLASAPSTKNTEKGFALLLWSGREINKVDIEMDLQARKWVGKYGALDSTDKNGDDFQTAFDKALSKFEDTNGTLQERAAKAFGVKPSELLKGNKLDKRSAAEGDTQLAGDVVDLPQIVVTPAAGGGYQYKVYDSQGLRGQGSASNPGAARDAARKILSTQRART
jgi:hypothetical protein